MPLKKGSGKKVISENIFSMSPSEDSFLAYWLEIRREDRLGVIASQKRDRSNYKAKSSTPHSRLLNSTRARMWAALKGKTNSALFSRLGYTFPELAMHLQAQFRDGMTWMNYGEWHVDHKKPCARFNLLNEEEFKECWSLENLQPLWALDNVKKGASYGEA